jgi:hypothetical protein
MVAQCSDRGMRYTVTRGSKLYMCDSARLTIEVQRESKPNRANVLYERSRSHRAKEDLLDARRTRWNQLNGREIFRSRENYNECMSGMTQRTRMNQQTKTTR